MFTVLMTSAELQDPTSEAISSIPIVFSVIVVVFVLIMLGALFMDFSDNLRDKRLVKFSKPVPAIIGYKRAIFLGPTVPRPFQGVTGTEYGVQDYSVNGVGFHMYKDFIDAKNHPQEGDIYLEVTGYGTVQEFGLGYTTTQQRVVQIIIDGCELPGCNYPASGWDDRAAVWLCDLHGRMVHFASNSFMSFEQIEEKLEKAHGHRVAVRSIAAPRKRGFLKKYAQKSVLPKFVPVTELVTQPSDEESGALVNN